MSLIYSLMSNFIDAFFIFLLCTKYLLTLEIVVFFYSSRLPTRITATGNNAFSAVDVTFLLHLFTMHTLSGAHAKFVSLATFHNFEMQEQKCNAYFIRVGLAGRCYGGM